jgi:hypothetical protein
MTAGGMLKQLERSLGGEHTHRTAASPAGVSEYAQALSQRADMMEPGAA